MDIIYVLGCCWRSSRKRREIAIHEVYIPSTGLTTDNKNLGWHVYFDLENYPFYQKAKEIIGKEDKPKGVFRF